MFLLLVQVSTKRGSETAVKAGRFMWVSRTLDFILWAKGTSRLESLFDEPGLILRDGESNDASSTPTATSKSGTPTKSASKKAYNKSKKQPKCIAIEDIVSVAAVTNGRPAA